MSRQRYYIMDEVSRKSKLNTTEGNPRMARKSQQQNTSKAANLAAAQMRAAIPRLKKRIDELSLLNLPVLSDETGDNVLNDHVHKIDAALSDIFGHESLEYERYKIESLSAMPMVFSLGSDLSFHGRLQFIRAEVDRAISTLQSIIEIFEERLHEADQDSLQRTLRAYEGLELHREIARAASELYRNGHYAESVVASVKVLNALVRLRSGLDIDGTTLMERTFSPNNPILKFNDLSDQSDKDEQKGFMQMFSGAVCGLRNPRAHGVIHDKPERALEFIAYVSLTRQNLG